MKGCMYSYCQRTRNSSAVPFPFHAARLSFHLPLVMAILVPSCGSRSIFTSDPRLFLSASAPSSRLILLVRARGRGCRERQKQAYEQKQRVHKREKAHEQREASLSSGAYKHEKRLTGVSLLAIKTVFERSRICISISFVCFFVSPFFLSTSSFLPVFSSAVTHRPAKKVFFPFIHYSFHLVRIS